MTPITQDLMILSAGALSLWLPFGFVWHRHHQSVQQHCGQEIARLEPATQIRVIGLALFAASVLLPLLIAIGISDADRRPGDAVSAFLIGLIMPGFAGLGGWTMARADTRLCTNGIVGWSAWGMPRFMTWGALQAIEVDGSGFGYKLSGTDKPLRIAFPGQPERLHHWLLTHAPQVDWSLLSQSDVSHEAEDAHRTDMNKAAPWFSLGSLVVLLATLPWATIKPTGLLLATLAGLALAAPIVLRNLGLNTGRRLGQTIQIIGVLIGSVLMNAASRFSDFEPTGHTDPVGWASLFHVLAITLCVAGSAVWISRR